MTSIAALAVLEVFLLIVVYVVYRVLVRGVPLGKGYEIEVRLLPPSIRVKLNDDDRR
jgi:hypothetical protein